MLITSVTINGDSHAIHSWDDIVAAINQLDGNSITQCLLFRTQKLDSSDCPEVNGCLEVERGSFQLRKEDKEWFDYRCTFYQLLDKDTGGDPSISRIGQYAAYPGTISYCKDVKGMLSVIQEHSETWSCREDLFDSFRGTFMLVHSDQVTNFIKDFNLTLVRDTRNWFNLYYHGDEDKLTVSCDIKGYKIVVGSTDALEDELCRYFSTESDAYRFCTDIDQPTAYFEYYKNQKLVRRHEVNLNMDTYEEEYVDFGNELEFEDEIETFIEQLDSPLGYDGFFLPLAVLRCLGITLSDLDSSLYAPCPVYQLPHNILDILTLERGGD